MILLKVVKRWHLILLKKSLNYSVQQIFGVFLWYGNLAKQSHNNIVIQTFFGQIWIVYFVENSLQRFNLKKKSFCNRRIIFNIFRSIIYCMRELFGLLSTSLSSDLTEIIVSLKSCLWMASCICVLVTNLYFQGVWANSLSKRASIYRYWKVTSSNFFVFDAFQTCSVQRACQDFHKDVAKVAEFPFLWKSQFYAGLWHHRAFVFAKWVLEKKGCNFMASVKCADLKANASWAPQTWGDIRGLT